MKAPAASLKREDIKISTKCYGIDALVAMAQGLFCLLLTGTIINTISTQLHLAFLTSPVATIASTEYTVSGFASTMFGPAMATIIGWALRCPPLVLFLLITVGFASNMLDGAGGPLAAFFAAIPTIETSETVSKETQIDILVTPLVTVAVGLLFPTLLAPTLGKAAMKVGDFVTWAAGLQPFLMGILVSLVADIVLTLPINSTAIYAALGLTGPADDAASVGCRTQMVSFTAISYPENGFGGLVSQGISTLMPRMGNIVRNPKVWIAPCVISMTIGPIAICMFHLQQNGIAVTSGMGTCGLVGPFGVYTSWVEDVTAGQKTAITNTDRLGMLLVIVILPVILYPLIRTSVRRVRLAKNGDLKLV